MQIVLHNHIQYRSVDTTHLRAGAVRLFILEERFSTWTVWARAGDFVAVETALGVACVVSTTAPVMTAPPTAPHGAESCKPQAVPKRHKCQVWTPPLLAAPLRFSLLPSGSCLQTRLRLQSKSVPTHPDKHVSSCDAISYIVIYVFYCCLCILRRGYPDWGFSVLFPRL